MRVHDFYELKRNGQLQYKWDYILLVHRVVLCGLITLSTDVA